MMEVEVEGGENQKTDDNTTKDNNDDSTSSSTPPPPLPELMKGGGEICENGKSHHPPPPLGSSEDDENANNGPKEEEGEEDSPHSECLDDPNFAVICSFLGKFGQFLRLEEVAFDELQAMMECTTHVPEPLVKLHILLLRRVVKTVVADKWERALAKFCHYYSNQDGWEIERFGYKNAKLQTKLRLMKHLLEAQFDYNLKFKAEVNKLQAGELRLVPLGQDTEGQLYWYQVDNDANLRVYREDVDDESWEIVAYNREGMCDLISKLQGGEVIKRHKEPEIVDEDSNEKDIETNGILLDTGICEEDEEDDEEMPDLTKEVEESQPAIKASTNGESSSKNKEPPVPPPPPIKEEGLLKAEEPKSKAIKEEEKVEKMEVNEDNCPPVDSENDTEIKNVSVKKEESESVRTEPTIVDSVIEKADVKSETQTEIKSLEQEEESMSQSVVQSETTPISVSTSAQPALETSVEEMKKTEQEASPVAKPEPIEPVKEEEAKIESLPVKESEQNTEVLKIDKPEPVEETLSKPTKKDVQEISKPLPEAKEIPEEKETSKDVPDIPATSEEKEPSISKDLPEVPATSEEKDISKEQQQDQSVQEQDKPGLMVDDIKPSINDDPDPVQTSKDEPAAPVSKDVQTLEEPAANPVVESVVEKEKQSTIPIEETVTLTTSTSVSIDVQPLPEENKLNDQIPSNDDTVEVSNSNEAAPVPISATSEDDPPKSQPQSATESEPREPKPKQDIVPDEIPPAPGLSESVPAGDSVADLSSAPVPDTTEKSEEKMEIEEEKGTDLNSEQKVEDKSKALEESSSSSTLAITEGPAAISSIDPAANSEDKVELEESKEQKSDSKPISESEFAPPPPEESSSAIHQEEKVAKHDIPAPLDEVETTSSSTSEPQKKDQRESDTPEKSEAEVEPNSISNPPEPQKEKEGAVHNMQKKSGLGLMSLVAYGSDSDSMASEDASLPLNNEKLYVTPSELTSNKRKVSEEPEGPEDIPAAKMSKQGTETDGIINMVGEAIEESVMIITGEGSGAPCEGGNNDQKENENLSQSGGASESATVTPTKGRGPRKGRKKSELEQLGVPLDVLEVNGDGGVHQRPVRASRRIAEIRLKEEEERRKLEEERLAELKAEAMRRQERKANKKAATPKKEGDPTSYVPPSTTDGSSEEAGGDEDDDDDEYEGGGSSTKKKRRKRKNGKPKPGGRPWATDSEDEEHDEAVEEEEEYHYEEEEHLVFNESDHEFSPESDLGEDDSASPLRHARTAKRGEEEEDETGCKKCGKGDHPEWILLCDACDSGWHASCLKPQLWVIPEGEWFCPPCQHNMLIEKLNLNLVEYDKLLHRRENEILRKKRLAFVNISLDNVLPEKQKLDHQKEKEHKHEERQKLKKERSRRRRILSDEELSDRSDNFIASDNSGEERRGERSHSGSEDSDGPIYRLRARRTAKKFDYSEYDEMINSACRASDEEFIPGEGEDFAQNGDENENVDETEEALPGELVPETVLEEGEEEPGEESEPAAEDMEEGEEEIDEKESKRLEELEKASRNKRKKRSLRDLDAFSDSDADDEEFHVSEVEDEDEPDDDLPEESDESEWSGDKDESDDSIAVDAGRKGRHRDQYLDVSVRRSTRSRRRPKIQYDDSDEEEEEEEEDKWNSEESEESEETPSDSDDDTYGRQKKKKQKPKRPAKRPVFTPIIPKKKQKGKGKPKQKGSSKKKKRGDEEDVDRAWNSSRGKKKSPGEEKVERRTRGMKINFKDILDSGESDDDGNIRPKRRRLSGEDEDEAEASRRLAEKIKAANQREAALYAKRQREEQAAAAKAAIARGEPVPEVPSDPDTAPSTLPGPPPLIKDEEKPMTTPPPSPQAPIVEQQLPVPPVLIPSQPPAPELLNPTPVPAPPVPKSLVEALKKKPGRKKKGSQSQSPVVPIPASVVEAVKSQPQAGPNISTSPMLAASGIGVPLPPSTTGQVIRVPAPQPPVVSSPEVKATGPVTSAPVGPGPISSPLQIPSTAAPVSVQSTMMQQPSSLMTALQASRPSNIPLDINRVPNPSLFPGGKSFAPPMWTRNPTAPHYGIPTTGAPPGKSGPPPPTASAFMSQAATRPTYSPHDFRMSGPPNPSAMSPIHFRRDGPGSIPPGAGPLYRPPPGGLPSLLSGFQGSPERFFAAPPHYNPYGILPPHPQGQLPQGFFGANPFDFRPGGDGPPPGVIQNQPLPPSTSAPTPLMSNHPPSQKDLVAPPHSGPVPIPPPSDSEFGGLVSYFSSQRTDDDMDA